MLGTQVLRAHLCSDVLDLSCAFPLVLNVFFHLEEDFAVSYKLKILKNSWA